MDKTREKTLVKPQSAKSRPLCFNKHCSLTGLSIYAILLKTTQYKANRAEYSTDQHKSVPLKSVCLTSLENSIGTRTMRCMLKTSSGVRASLSSILLAPTKTEICKLKPAARLISSM